MATKSNHGSDVTQLTGEPSTLVTKSDELDLANPAICVICLDRVADEAIALPCKHDQFHFSCLGTWLGQSRHCPLCKREVKGIRYRDADTEPQKIFYLAAESSIDVAERSQRRPNIRRRGRLPRSPLAHPSTADSQDKALTIRKEVYRQTLYTLYVGSNKYSGYRSLTPEIIRNDEALLAKAKKWIRRELAVFDFLQPDSPSFGQNDRRASNAEYLLDYIIAILKNIDLRGSAGQAQELLKDFLGRQNAQLFLHELEAWLRSPYERLKDWDDAAQYSTPGLGFLKA